MSKESSLYKSILTEDAITAFCILATQDICEDLTLFRSKSVGILALCSIEVGVGT